MSVKRKSSFSSKAMTMRDMGEFTEKVVLPGVEAIIDKRINPLEVKVDKLESKIDAGFAEMRKGFADVSRSIQVLGGDVAELKEDKKENEERFKVLERKVGVR